MDIIRTLIVVSVIGGGYAYWHNHRTPLNEIEYGVQMNSSSQITSNGFAYLPSADRQNSKTVYVVAAENCPHEDAQRADHMASDLSQKGIPVERIHDVQFIIPGQPDSSTMARISSIMEGPLPIVFISGRAKSNPSIEEVVAEFNSSGNK